MFETLTKGNCRKVLLKQHDLGRNSTQAGIMQSM